METLTEWKPKASQVELLSIVQDAGYALSISQACANATLIVSRRTWYDWTHSPEFMEWWATERERYWASRLSELDVATFTAATTTGAPGSTHDRRLLYERYDRKFKPQTRQEVAGTVELQVSQLPDAELERRAHALGVAEPMPAIEGRVIEPEAIPAELSLPAESASGDE